MFWFDGFWIADLCIGGFGFVCWVLYLPFSVIFLSRVAVVWMDLICLFPGC